MDVQFDLFEGRTEIDLLRQEVAAYKESADKVRRGVFARQNALMKEIFLLKVEVEELKKQGKQEHEVIIERIA